MSQEKRNIENTGDFPHETKSVPAGRVEQITENVARVQRKEAERDIENQRRIEKAESDSGLPLSEIVAARKETGIFEKISGGFMESGFSMAAIGSALQRAAWGFAGTKMKSGPSPAITQEVFRPEAEVKKILKAPKEERQELLREFKKNLTEQKKGIAAVQTFFMRTLKYEPETPLSTLQELAEKEGDARGLSPEQKEIVKGFLLEYKGRHDGVMSVRGRYPDDKELFKALFGRSPKGEIKVIQGPITLFIRCFDVDDYAFIHSEAFLLKEEPSDEKKKKELAELIDLAKTAGGCRIGYTLVPELEYGTVTLENDPGKTNTPSMARLIFGHEEQHALKILLGERTRSGDLWARIRRTKTLDEAEPAIRNFVRANREALADEFARDEILAYYKMFVTWDKILDYLTKPEKEGGLYDYFKDKKKKILTSPYLASALEHLGAGYKPILEKIVSQVYGDEYVSLLKKGIKAVQTIAAFGYAQDEAIALFIHEPLRRWEKVAERFVAGRARPNSMTPPWM